MHLNCDKCGGHVVIARVGTLPEVLNLTGTTGKDTTGDTTPVEARVCLECGYIALYAADPRVLRRERETAA